jgi:hypothetical protein
MALIAFQMRFMSSLESDPETAPDREAVSASTG